MSRLSACVRGGISMALLVSAVPVTAQIYQPMHPAPPALQELRRHMFDASVNSLTFRSIETIMDTRKVPNGGPVWTLPREDRSLDFTYTFKGETRSAQEALDRTYTNALLIIKDGRIVYEEYRNNADETSRYMSWSVGKSITATLIGIAIADGKIGSVNDQVVKYLPELKKTGYDGVTLRQVLQMRSGIAFQERRDPQQESPSEETRRTALVENSRRYADAALKVKRANAPGSTFKYNTLDTTVLGWVLERATGQSITDYTANKFWRPLGAESHAAYMMDGPPGEGREFNGAGFIARLRDFGRFGQMILDGGVTPQGRVVPEAWIREATQPTNSEVNGLSLGYGYQWWTVSGTQAFIAIGLQGQFVFIDPQTRTVAVKLSYTPPSTDEADPESLAFLKAAAQWQPKGER